MRCITTMFLLATSFSALAGDLTIPNTFQPNTPARAADVNANFTAVEASVNDNAVTIAALTSQIADLSTRLSAAELLLANAPDPTALYAELDNKISVGEPICSTTTNTLGGYLRDRDTGEITSSKIVATIAASDGRWFIQWYDHLTGDGAAERLTQGSTGTVNFVSSAGAVYDAVCITP